MYKLALLGLIGILSTDCGPVVKGLVTVENRRVWVVVDDGKVFRCADAHDADQPPRPVCVRAPLSSSAD